MADIAFLLLIFFLVSTDIQQDAGLPAVLPPLESGANASVEPPALAVLVASDGALLVDEAATPMSDLDEAISGFLQRSGAGSGAVVDLSVPRDLRYVDYIGVYDAAQRAFNQQREAYAMARWGRTGDALAPAERVALNEAWPRRIREVVRE